MADLEFDSYDGGYPAGPQRFGRAINIAGAVCSVALVLGLGVWGYRLAVRDVTGVPVFRAVEGPLRMAPADPGGQQAMHQGLSVNAVAAAGTARPVPDSLRLAPKDVDLAAEDVAGLADLPLAVQPAALDAPVVTPAPLVAAEEQSAVSAAVAEAVLNEVGAAPVQDSAIDAALADATAGAVSDAVAPADAPKLTAPAIRPRARPTNLHQAAASVADVTAVAPVAAAPVDVANLAAGAQLVQLGAFDDEAQAKREWDRLQGQFVDLFGGKAMVVQAAQSGGRTFYRLRAAGFAGADEARGFCNTLLSGNSTCIPVTQR